MTHNLHVRGATTIDTPSDGASLPQAVIHVLSTSGPPAFAGSGTITVNTTAGPQSVNYTGTTGTTFTGCTGGTGTMHTGYAVADGWQGIQRSELTELDANLSRGINAVDGCTCAPAAPPMGSQIVISGSLGGGVVVNAPTKVRYGASLSTSGLNLYDGDYPIIDPSNQFSTRTVAVLFTNARGAVSSLWRGRREWGGALQAAAPMFDLSDGLGMRPSIARMHLRPPDGATLTSVTVHFRVAAPHASLPAIMPAARVYAMTPQGGFFPLTSIAAGADAFGYIYAPTPSNPTAWYNNGAPQSFTIPIDQNNLINVGSYDYIIEIVDEQGLTDFPFGLTVLQPVRCVATGAVSQRGGPGGTTTIDGLTLAEGDRVLCVGQGSTTQNGIFIVHLSSPAAPWTRAPDLLPSTFRRGFVVPVSSGNAWAGMLYQNDQSIGSWSPGAVPSTVQWAAGSGAGDPEYMIPSTQGKETGLAYTMTGSATGGSPEPQWPTVSGGTVLDSSGNTWTAVGPNATPLVFLSVPDKSYPLPTDGFVAYGTIWHAAVATYANIGDMRPQ